MLDGWPSIAIGRRWGRVPREVVSQALGQAVRAPSGQDRERWVCCLADADVLEMYVDRIGVPDGVDPAGRESIIDCGAALMRLCVALRALRYTARVDLLPDRAEPDLLARVRLESSSHRPTAADDAMAAALARQQRPSGTTSDSRAITPHVLSLLLGAARLEGAWLGFVSAPSLRREVVRCAAIATRSQGRPAAQACIERASAIAVLMTSGDMPADWLVAGLARARMVLTASAAGVVASFVNEPISVPLIRPLVSRLVREAGDPGVPGARGAMPLDAVPQSIVCLSHVADPPVDHRSSATSAGRLRTARSRPSDGPGQPAAVASDVGHKTV